MTIGPVEYVLISFPDNDFNGDIAPAIADLVDSGTVRIIDLVFLKKDEDGNILSFEYDDLPQTAAYGDIDGDADGFMSDEDIEFAAAALAPNSAALLIIWEDLWAAPLANAVWESGGVLLAGSRIPHDIVLEAIAIFEDAQGELS